MSLEKGKVRAVKKKEDFGAMAPEADNKDLVVEQKETENQEESQPKTVTLTMDELKKLIAEEVEKAKPKSGQVNEDKTPEKIESDQEKKEREYYEELVEVELFFDGDKYKDDVIVYINGKAWQLQRGVPVKVPRFVKEVLDSSAKQDVATRRMVQKLTTDFTEKTSLYT